SARRARPRRPGRCGRSPSWGRPWSTPRWPPPTPPPATPPPGWPPPSRSWPNAVTRGAFTVRVKEELAALRPAAPAERRGPPGGLFRFAATLHIGGTLGPRYTLVLATGSGGVARLAFWLLHAGYGVRPDLRLREAGALAPRAHYELVLADRVERVLTDSGILDGAGRLSFGVPGGLVRGREAAACFARGAFLGRGAVGRPRPARPRLLRQGRVPRPGLGVGPDPRAPSGDRRPRGTHRRRPGRRAGAPRPARPHRPARPRRAAGGGQGRRGHRPGPARHGRPHRLPGLGGRPHPAGGPPRGGAAGQRRPGQPAPQRGRGHGPGPRRRAGGRPAGLGRAAGRPGRGRGPAPGPSRRDPR